MKPANLLIICSDEHARSALACYGNPVVRTPNLDRLAAGGVRFTNAYTPSPVCVPARASMATGRYIHEIGTWSSAEPYRGIPAGWGHRLMSEGHRVVSIGKLHYRSSDDANGFDPEILPMHVLDGIGWTLGLKRSEPLPAYDAPVEFANDVGPGESAYTRYDRNVLAAALTWLEEEGTRDTGKPWALFVSFVAPHYPLRAPQPFFDLYACDDLGEPLHPDSPHRGEHPVLRRLAGFYDYDRHFNAENRRTARQAYFGLCSFLDDNVGQLLTALVDNRLADATRVLYLTDHGEMLGDHGFWTKCVMYENSVGIPMILSGPGVPKGMDVDTPVSLIDVDATVLEGLGVFDIGRNRAPGISLFSSVASPEPDRVVFSEFHDGGAITGVFMIRWGPWKYVHYVGHPPQLFDLENDPTEGKDLGRDPIYTEIRERCEAKLRTIVDPERVNAQAFSDQKARLAQLRATGLLSSKQDFGFTPPQSGTGS